MNTFTIQLPTELADYVQGLIDRKAFDSTDALMAYAVCLLGVCLNISPLTTKRRIGM